MRNYIPGASRVAWPETFCIGFTCAPTLGASRPHTKCALSLNYGAHGAALQLEPYFRVV
jgi:hypothetical protein